MDYNKMVTALSFGTFDMVLALLLVHSIAVISKLSLIYCLIPLLYQKLPSVWDL